MEPTEAKRRLSAIMMADVAGYSRLMGEDERATLRTLTAHREIFSQYVQRHDGRIVNAPGDSILAEFGSVVDAVGCAAEIQRELAEKNAELPANRAMLFRIGINLGDVMVRGKEIYGDDVNIAARLESLADPGGICISRSAHDRVVGKLPLEFEYLGRSRARRFAPIAWCPRAWPSPHGLRMTSAALFP
ncbi:MAG: adenylate/guanylate cyclase domain-containing protein [SAR324 cluster bacterium]|nr:adenylate/guanylate cyclase domain-containing protein [SAR324 cluster bacterium]